MAGSLDTTAFVSFTMPVPPTTITAQDHAKFTEYVLAALKELDWSKVKLAQEAGGMSPTTLSRCINQPDDYPWGGTTRNKIREAIETERANRRTAVALADPKTMSKSARFAAVEAIAEEFGEEVANHVIELARQFARTQAAKPAAPRAQFAPERPHKASGKSRRS